MPFSFTLSEDIKKNLSEEIMDFYEIYFCFSRKISFAMKKILTDYINILYEVGYKKLFVKNIKIENLLFYLKMRKTYKFATKVSISKAI